MPLVTLVTLRPMAPAVPMARLVQPTRLAVLLVPTRLVAARIRSLSALFYGICVSPRHL